MALPTKWTYTQTRITADTTSALCEGMDKKEPLVNSWMIEDQMLLDCKLIEFGF